ncbi:nuclear protein MDM1 isoform X5 [Melanerpes formicivorus]|uniref:nuclear protein MDM1 isoform X5 n=1 Tax=Melanerpes formicivorus TaxID=211600 RepID=UPI00358E66FF
MNVSDGKAVKEASPEGAPEQEGGLDSPDCALRSGEVAKKDRQLARHCTGCRTGLSEYKRNFKWKTPERCNPSPQQKSLWAGLRSDQFGITREPNFISKRRVPYHNPQISKSFEWTGDCDLDDPVEAEGAPRAAEVHTEHSNNDVIQERAETPEGPRLPPKVRSRSLDSRGEAALVLAEGDMKRSTSAAPLHQNGPSSSPQKELGKMGNGLHRALQRKAGMNISHLSTLPRNSEYQSQFVWRSPHEKSPILAAEQVISNTSKSMPPPKTPAITSAPACERNSKESLPVKDPQEGGGSHGKESLVQEQASQNTLNSMWYMEVKELRERAKAYRQRVEGTHFSRYHLNQILSDNNSLWDVSSTSSSEEGISSNIRALDLAGVSDKETAPSPKMLQQPDSREQPHQDSTERKELPDASAVPVKRRLAWGEPEGTKERENPKATEEEGTQDEQAAVVAQQLEGTKKDVNEDKKEGESALVLNSSAAVSNSSSASSRVGGRLPTPKLRALGGARRTHHDLTTPAVGGAVLVSPPKLRSSSSQRRTRGLGAHPSAAKKGAREASKRRPFQGVEAVSLLTSPPAGLGTLDPLPLRQELWPPNSVSNQQVPIASAHQRHSSTPPVLKSAQNCAMPFWKPSPRIQGTLKDPEFQHNGNLGNPKPRSFQLPLQERNHNDEEDRLSQISARSAASSSLASQILERAQKRKDFWGKT